MARAALMAAIACSVPCMIERAARAEASAADKETARRLMAEARDKRGAGDLKGSLQSFVAADALMKVPTTGLEVARTQALLGLLVEARDTALRVARSQPEPDEPAPFTKAREEATSISEDLVKRIPTLTVQVAGGEPGGAPNVTVDGASIPAASLGMPRTVNPGHHVVAAIDGRKQGRAEVDISEAQHKDLRVELAGAAVPPPTPPPDAPPAGPGPGKALMIGGGIVAVLGIGVGSVTGVMSLSKTSSVKSTCVDNKCPASQQSNLDSAQTLATISTVSFVAGGVGAIVGLVGLLMWRGEWKVEVKSAGATVAPWIGVGSAGVSGVF